MEICDASINVSKKTGVSIFRVRIKNVKPCSFPNYLTGMPEDNNLCNKNGKVFCVSTSTALPPLLLQQPL
jgi:hypothetical protein